jgi:hypothetical protein
VEGKRGREGRPCATDSRCRDGSLRGAASSGYSPGDKHDRTLSVCIRVETFFSPVRPPTVAINITNLEPIAYPQGADLPPPPPRVAKAGETHLKEEIQITPSSPLG